MELLVAIDAIDDLVHAARPLPVRPARVRVDRQTLEAAILRLRAAIAADLPDVEEPRVAGPVGRLEQLCADAPARRDRVTVPVEPVYDALDDARQFAVDDLRRQRGEMAAPRSRAPSVRVVDVGLPRPRPERVSLDGDRVRVEPLDPARHGSDLFRLGHDGSPGAEESWEYLPYGPFASESEHRAWLEAQAAGEDPLFFAIVDRREERAVGIATLLSIVPAHGSIEIGHIWLSPRLQRTAAATEALVLLLRYAMDDLGYRRMEWKCNAANRASRRAAQRLGFHFEGIFYNHLVFKGRNRDTAWFSILDEEWPRLRNAYATWLAADNFGPDGAQRRRLSEFTAA